MLHLILALVAFYTMHSVLAWTGVKHWVAVHWGLVRWYRLTYSIISAAQLAWVVHAYRASGGTLLMAQTSAMVCTGWALLLAGGVLSAIPVLRFGGAGFLGLVPERSVGLVRSGLHGLIRHPIYTGIILASFGWSLLSFTLPTLVVVGITFLYLPIGIHLEEIKLIGTFGEDYRQYKREVPALIPDLCKR